jgi:hypothetical protein
MSTVLFVITGYLTLGAILLLIFDLLTKRIRSKFSCATKETQTRLLASGNYVGGRASSVLFIGALWLFWPAVFIGAITDKKENTNGS